MGKRNSFFTPPAPEFSVGQRYFYVPSEMSRKGRTSKPGYWLTVSRLGRRWVYLTREGDSDESYRVDRNAEAWYQLDGGVYSSPGRLYESGEAYRDAQESREILSRISETLRAPRAWEFIPLANARQAAASLGVPSVVAD